jgi:hypothetical protein
MIVRHMTKYELEQSMKTYSDGLMHLSNPQLVYRLEDAVSIMYTGRTLRGTQMPITLRELACYAVDIAETEARKRGLIEW